MESTTKALTPTTEATMTSTAQTIFETKHHDATWNGRPGTSWSLGRTRNAAERLGERVSVIRWTDNGDLQLRHCKGDGRRADFIVFAETIIPNGTDSDAIAYAEQRFA